jgi:hypothetical protein
MRRQIDRAEVARKQADESENAKLRCHLQAGR